MIADTLIFLVTLAGQFESDPADIASIDVSECHVAGLTIGSSYAEVVTALGEPEQEHTVPGATAADAGSLRLNYDGLSVATVQNVVTALLSRAPRYALPSGIGPQSTRKELVSAYGETRVLASERREVFTYRCEGSTFPLGDTVLLVTVADGHVEAVAIAVKVEP